MTPQGMFLSGELDNLGRLLILSKQLRIHPAGTTVKYFYPSRMEFLSSRDLTQ